MKSKLLIKERGAHFTPADIAEYIAKRVVSLANIDKDQNIVYVLDPACGDGELLIAALFAIRHINRNAKLIGIDTDAETVNAAESRIRPLLQKGDELDLRCADFLSCKPETDASLLDLVENNFNKPNLLPLVDIIIANPPYVRTQVMGAQTSQTLSKKYRLTGKVDLYHAFFINYGQYLKPSGALGVITSNRYLYTKSGSVVRKYLNQELDIDYIADLGDTKIFSAAVLPALLFGSLKKQKSIPIACTRIYEIDGTETYVPVGSVADILRGKDGVYLLNNKRYKKESGHIRDTSNYQEPWILASSEQERWLDQIDSAAFCRIQDIGKVRVGVKTTADNVFIRDDWDNLKDESPERQWIKPLISSGNTARWKATDDDDRKILYPYYTSDEKRKVANLSDYPHMKDYFEKHYEQLSSRQYVLKANREWYEIWVPQDPSAWLNPKVVFPDISSEARFLIDESGAIVDGNCYWIQAKDNNNDILYLIVAVANSSLMKKYHSLAFQNVLYAGKRRYLTQYVSKYPIPDPTSAISRELIDYVKSAIRSGETVDEERVDKLVAQAFNINT